MPRGDARGSRSRSTTTASRPRRATDRVPPGHNTVFMPHEESRARRAVRAATPPALLSLARAAPPATAHPGVISRRRQPREPAQPDLGDLSSMFRWCLARGLGERPHYVWGSLLAAHTAAALGYERFSAIEFGVAGGNGLLALERAASAAAELLGVEAEVFGFDTGTGMPAPVDHRDVPWTIPRGCSSSTSRPCGRGCIDRRAGTGPVAQTVPEWLLSERAPLAFAAFDLDYYSATADALAVFDARSAAAAARRVLLRRPVRARLERLRRRARRDRGLQRRPRAAQGRQGAWAALRPPRTSSCHFPGTSRSTSPTVRPSRLLQAGGRARPRGGWTRTACRRRPDGHGRAGGRDPDPGPVGDPRAARSRPWTPRRRPASRRLSRSTARTNGYPTRSARVRGRGSRPGRGEGPGRRATAGSLPPTGR